LRETISIVGRDVRHALRFWLKSPGVSVPALASLTLTIGAAAAVFTVFDALLWRALPVKSPSELHAVALPDRDANVSPPYFSYPFYTSLSTTLPDLTFIASSVTISPGVNVAQGSTTTRLRAELVSGNYFQVLGVSARLGRVFSADDDRAPGAHPVVVLSHSAWLRDFAGRDDIVGQSILVNGQPFSVAGVASQEFFGTRTGFVPDLWAPLTMTVEMSGGAGSLSPNTNYVELMARIRPGAQLGSLQADFSATHHRWLGSVHPRSVGSRANEYRLVPAGAGLSLLRGQYRQPLTMLLGMVSVLVVVAYANVANLLLARGVGRRKELAVRLSLGATRARLVRQSLVECAVLTGTSGLLAWGTSVLLGRFLLSYVPVMIGGSQFAAGWRTFVFVALAGVAGTAVFAAVQLRPARSADLAHDLKRAAAGGGGATSDFPVQSVLTILQVVLSLVLVAASLVLGRSLSNLMASDMGFRRDNVLVAALDPGKSGYSDERAEVFYDALLDRVRALPGVNDTALASYGSLSGLLPAGTRFLNTAMHGEGRDLQPNEDATVYLNIVTPDSFANIGPRLLRGRDFSKDDRRGGLPVAVVNEAAAKFFFGADDPIGRRIGSGQSGPATIEIVGVVRDAKYLNIREDPRRTVYRPLSQAPRSLMTLHVSTKADPAAVAPLVEREVRALDPTVPLFQVQSMRGRIDDSLRQERLMAALGRALGTLGSLLAMIGLYGVVNYAVVRDARHRASHGPRCHAASDHGGRVPAHAHARARRHHRRRSVRRADAASLRNFPLRRHQHRASADRDSLGVARCHRARSRAPARLARLANRSAGRTSTERMTGEPANPIGRRAGA
jgi:predicted permease